MTVSEVVQTIGALTATGALAVAVEGKIETAHDEAVNSGSTGAVLSNLDDAVKKAEEATPTVEAFANDKEKMKMARTVEKGKAITAAQDKRAAANTDKEKIAKGKANIVTAGTAAAKLGADVAMGTITRNSVEPEAAAVTQAIDSTTKRAKASCGNSPA